MAMRSTDRILVLEKIDPKGDTGLIDPKVFKGENNLHAVMDQGTCLWSFKHDRGMVPAPLRNKYTSFKAAREQAEEYFRQKNIRIVEVKD
jgi:hypothetical protein